MEGIPPALVPRLCQLDNDLCRTVLRGKCCPSAWTDLVASATSSSEPYVVGDPGGDSVYPERAPTVAARSSALREIDIIRDAALQTDLTGGLVIALIHAYTAFLVDARLSIMITKNYGAAQLGMFNLVPLPKWANLGIKAVRVDVAGSDPPKGTVDRTAWTDDYVRMKELGDTSLTDSGRGLALFLGPGRLINHVCTKPSLSKPRPVEAGAVHSCYAWYGIYQFDLTAQIDVSRVELFWTYRSKYSYARPVSSLDRILLKETVQSAPTEKGLSTIHPLLRFSPSPLAPVVSYLRRWRMDSVARDRVFTIDPQPEIETSPLELDHLSSDTITMVINTATLIMQLSSPMGQFSRRSHSSTPQTD